MDPDHKLVITLTPSSDRADAVRRGGYLYTAAVSAVDERGGIVAPGDLAGQAAYIYRRLDEILKAADTAWSDVVKVNSYLAPEAITPAGRSVVDAAHRSYL